MAPHSNKLKLMRVVVREDFSKSRCDALICDIKAAVQNLDKLDAGKVKAHEESAQPTPCCEISWAGC
jgi:glutamate decarboxylase